MLRVPTLVLVPSHWPRRLGPRSLPLNNLKVLLQVWIAPTTGVLFLQIVLKIADLPPSRGLRVKQLI